MGSFWLKIAVLVVVIFAVLLVADNFTSKKPQEQPKQETKGFYEVIKEDDQRLREDIPVDSNQAAPKAEASNMNIEDKVQAERLFEMALTQRKMARLPGIGYKQMVDYCREIIDKYPSSNEAPKARRMLGEVPKQYWQQYDITEEEISG